MTAMTAVLPVRHLGATVPLAIRELIARAHADVVAVVEEPPGSNRGPVIDEYNRRAGVAPGSFWCASAAGVWSLDTGFAVPAGFASCDNWMTWAKKTHRWSTTPELGAMVLYGVPGDAKHIGLVVRLAPYVLSIEANTTVEGSRFERNGTAVAVKIADPKTDPILGYVLPFPRVATTSGIAA